MLHRCVSALREFTAAISYWCHEKIFKSSQISRISWNHKFTIFTTARHLCQINPVHLFPSHFFRSVLILPSQPRLGLLSCHSSRLSNKNPVRIILILPCIQHSLPIWVSFLGSLISAEELNVGGLFNYVNNFRCYKNFRTLLWNSLQWHKPIFFNTVLKTKSYQSVIS